MGRKFIGIELKESYWRVGAKNLASAVKENNNKQLGLFANIKE